MGSFYCNVTLLGVDVDSVRAAVPRPAFLAEQDDAVVVFASVDDEGAPQSGQGLSSALDCIAVSVGIHDDDILMFEIHQGGRSLLSGAVPDPAEYFGFDPGELGEFAGDLPGGDGASLTGSGSELDAEAIVRAVGRGDLEAVRTALTEDFVFASERHEALASALGLPLAAVGWGYRYLARDAEGYSGPPLTHI